MFVLCWTSEVVSEFIFESVGSCFFVGACSVSEGDLLSDVFRQQLARFMHLLCFLMWCLFA